MKNVSRDKILQYDVSFFLQQQQKEQQKGRKLGHRRVDGDGEVTYKKFHITQLMGSIQLGLQQSVGSLASVADRDLLMKDFMSIQTVSFTRDGALDKTPAHNYSEFRFRTYAPFAFKKFRDMFEIGRDDFLSSLCNLPMIELSNPGVSGSIFYLTQDDKFISKTVQHKEAGFLTKLLPGYYLNLKQARILDVLDTALLLISTFSPI
jgi:1-phosphatidylinositol-4-phosphate 5-kinase